MSNFQIHLASASDLSALHQLEEKCFDSDKLSQQQYKRYLEKGDKIFVIKNSNALIGLALLLIKQKSNSCRLYSFAIDPNYRGKKIGLLLYQHIEKYVRKSGFKKITLEVAKNNQKAIAFYKMNGFVTFSSYKNYYEDGNDAFRMHKFFGERLAGNK